jgi:hypothetical protein
MDRTTKVILAAIALGLWVNAGVFVFRPAPAVASNDALEGIAHDINRIADCYTGASDVYNNRPPLCR